MNARAADASTLAASLQPASDHVVVLDFDGTVSHIVDRPDDAALADGAEEAIASLARATDVMILSGRTVEDVRGRLHNLAVTVAGGHGTHIDSPTGSSTWLVDSDEASVALDAAEQDLRSLIGAHSGWLVERKHTSIAVHHRLAAESDVAEMLPRVGAMLAARTHAPPGFEIIEGKSVVELRVRGTDKGHAVDWFVAKCGGRRPIVIGDDVTDEDAFAAAQHHGGLAIIVGAPRHSTTASVSLADPDEVVTFLQHLASLEEKA